MYLPSIAINDLRGYRKRTLGEAWHRFIIYTPVEVRGPHLIQLTRRGVVLGTLLSCVSPARLG